MHVHDLNVFSTALHFSTCMHFVIVSTTNRCICGVLADKLVILVTHQLQYAQHANTILVLKEVCVLSGCVLLC